MNVCALDVVARSADFETVAATMEMRAWEWNFLHDIDGETALGEIARQRGVDLDSAIGLINDAMQRGLVVIPTVTLQAYRSHTAPQTSLRGTSPAVALGSSALADAPFDFAVAPSTGKISFSSDAFDWNAPEPAFEEAEDAPEVASAPEKIGSVHYDDRFGVEHPGGPFAATETHDEPFSVVSHHDAAAAHAAPVTHDEEEPVADVAPFADVAPALVDRLPSYAPLDDPFAPAAHVDDPFAEAAHVDDPFAEVAPHGVDDPFAAAPSENGKALTNGLSRNGHNPVRFDDIFAETTPSAPPHDEPAASFPPDPTPTPAPAPSTIHFDAASFDDVPFESLAETPAPAPAPTPVPAHVEPPATVLHAVQQPVHETAHDTARDAHDAIEAEPQAETGSISFSFSADEPAGSLETFEDSGVHESPEVWTPPTREQLQAAAAPAASTAPAPAVEPASAAAAEPAAAPRAPGTTQSLYYEREAIDTDAGRELDEKVKNWKDSLSWREQQQINEALGTGEKPGVIGSLLRALGVR